MLDRTSDFIVVRPSQSTLEPLRTSRTRLTAALRARRRLELVGLSAVIAAVSGGTWWLGAMMLSRWQIF